MLTPEKLRAGQSVRFWSKFDLQFPIPGLLPDQFKLFFFFYGKDGSFYTAGPEIAATIEQQLTVEGIRVKESSGTLVPGAKVSLHGTGEVLGPKVKETRRRGKPFPFKQVLLNLTKPQLLCVHWLAPIGAYVQPLQIERFEKRTDIKIDENAWLEAGLAVLLVALPHGSPIDEYHCCWTTTPLKDGNKVLIAARYEPQKSRPPHHLIRIYADADQPTS